MKSIIVMVMLALLSACSSTTKTFQGSEAGTTVRASGTGTSFEDAKTKAFNRAIEFVVGSVIVTQRESKNDRLVRDDILAHSSGYVDSYTVVSETRNGNSVTLTMDVVVKNSKIANRILNINPTDSTLNGDKLASQYATYLQSRGSVSDISKQVLNDYPSRAFTAKLVDSKFMVDIYNSAHLHVKYNVEWNYNYLVALNEVLTLASDEKNRSVRQGKVVVTSRKPGNWMGSHDTYYFNDSRFYSMFENRVKPSISVYAKITDITGKVIACTQQGQLGILTGQEIFVDGATPMVVEFDFNVPPSALTTIEVASNIETGVTFDFGYCNKR